MEKISKRNLGIDLLKCISMFMVVVLHFMGTSEVLFKTDNQLNYILAWILEALCIVAVNCFVFITGYFEINKEFKVKKLISLWGEVLFYTISIYIIGLIAGVFKFDLFSIKKSFSPVLNYSYWFVTVYIALYIFSPYINKMIKSISQKDFKRLIIILIGMFCIWNTLMPLTTTLDNSVGYSIIWLIVLYLIGAYERLYGKQEYDNNQNILMYILISIIMVASLFIFKYIQVNLNIKMVSDLLYRYNSITVLISSFCLFRFFSHLKLKEKNNYISKISQACFAVYLIHEMPLFVPILFKNIFKISGLINKNYFIPLALLEAIFVFGICICIELCRQLFVSKMCKKINFKYRCSEFYKKINGEKDGKES